MKKIYLLFAIAIVFIFAGPSAADWKSLSTGAGQARVASLTAPAAVSGIAVTGECAFHGLIVKTDGTNDVTLSIYANTAASGTKLIPEDIVVLGITKIFAYSLGPAIWCAAGIYVKVSVAGGGSCSWQVHYDQ